MIHLCRAQQIDRIYKRRPVVALLLCCLLPACASWKPPERSQSLTETGKSSSRTGSILAVSRAQADAKSGVPGTLTHRLSMEDRWRPAGGAGDKDSDGVLDKADRCPDTAAYITVDRDGCGLFDAVLQDVAFNPGSLWLSTDARKQLDQLAETLLAFPESRVQVRAHTDSQGDSGFNRQLSVRRADTVVQYLLSRGVNAQQLQGLGMGESVPVASNDTSDGRRRNRRVDIVTLPDQDAAQRTLAATHRASTQKAATQKNVRVISVSDPRQKSLLRDDVNVSNVSLAAATGKTGTHSRLPGVQSQPVLQAAMPTRSGSPAVSQASTRKPTIMPLPKPGVVRGVNISGVVKGLSFPAGSSNLSPGAQNSLAEVVRGLQENPQIRIAIMAHTDDQGSAADNLKLSMQRAQSVLSYLVEEGINADRLRAEGYGESLPLVQNLTKEDRAYNRRIDIRIQPDQ